VSRHGNPQPLLAQTNKTTITEKLHRHAHDGILTTHMIANTDNRKRALGLLSGSLDSYLAFHLMRQQPIQVDAMAFTSPFFDTSKASEAARSLGVNLVTQDITYQLAKALNEWTHTIHLCDLSLRTVLSEARIVMETQGYDFIFSGEIVRQHSDQMDAALLSHFAEEAGLDGLLLRPLSAQLLPPTRPEQEKWISPDVFQDLQGRNRWPQKETAHRLGIQNIVTNRRVCRLRDPVFKTRVLDLLDHHALGGINYLKLLHIGRHFRLDEHIKLVLGRNENENAEIEGSAELYDIIIRLLNRRGPTGLLPYTATEEHIQQAASICARYGDTQQQSHVMVRIRSPRQARDIRIEPATREQIESFRI